MAKAYAPLSVLFEQRRPSADEDARLAFCAWTTGRHHRGAPMSSARLASSRKSVERVIGFLGGAGGHFPVVAIPRLRHTMAPRDGRCRHCRGLERFLNHSESGGPLTKEPTFRFADCELDAAAYQLRRADWVIPLARQPMEALLLLVERHGELVSREDLARRLLGR